MIPATCHHDGCAHTVVASGRWQGGGKGMNGWVVASEPWFECTTQIATARGGCGWGRLVVEGVSGRGGRWWWRLAVEGPRKVRRLTQREGGLTKL